MKHILTITPEMIADPRPLGLRFGMALRDCMGRLLWIDAGKRVFESSSFPGVYTVESNGQRDKRELQH